jgi:hypothetical protein
MNWTLITLLAARASPSPCFPCAGLFSNSLQSRVISAVDRHALQLLARVAVLMEQQKSPPISRLYTSQGGWDRWLKSQLAFAMGSGEDITVRREEEVYEFPGLCADLFYENQGARGDDPKKRTIIELTCQSEPQDTASGPQAFTEAFKARINKVLDSPRKNVYEYIPVLLLGFGVGGKPVEEAKKEFGKDTPLRDNYRVSWVDTRSGFTLFWMCVPGKQIVQL